MVAEQCFLEITFLVEVSVQDSKHSTVREENYNRDFCGFILCRYSKNRMQLVSGDLRASERALKASRFIFRGIGIALPGATCFVFNVYK